jgi:uncharacterized phage protein (TIGR01671 family)
MREIKFRAWDKTYKRMNYKVQVGNTDYADQNYTCNSIWVDYGDNKSIGWMNADDKCIDLMQFTGLKDKNGKEIYEGDIVVWEVNEITRTAPVYFDELQASFWMGKDKNLGSLVLNDWMRGEYEVIGNIHENPELS